MCTYRNALKNQIIRDGGRTYTYTHNTKTKNRQDVVYRLPAFKMMEAERSQRTTINRPTLEIRIDSSADSRHCF